VTQYKTHIQIKTKSSANFTLFWTLSLTLHWKWLKWMLMVLITLVMVQPRGSLLRDQYKIFVIDFYNKVKSSSSLFVEIWALQSGIVYARDNCLLMWYLKLIPICFSVWSRYAIPILLHFFDLLLKNYVSVESNGPN